MQANTLENFLGQNPTISGYYTVLVMSGEMDANSFALIPGVMTQPQRTTFLNIIKNQPPIEK